MENVFRLYKSVNGMNYPVGGVQISGNDLRRSLGTVDSQPSIDGHDCELEIILKGGNNEFFKIKERGDLFIVGHVHLGDPARYGETGELVSADVSQQNPP